MNSFQIKEMNSFYELFYGETYMQTLIYIYKNESKIKKKGFLLILKASNQQRGRFDIEFDGTTAIAKSFSDNDLKFLKEQLVHFFGYAPFYQENLDKVFQTKGVKAFM